VREATKKILLKADLQSTFALPKNVKAKVTHAYAMGYQAA